MQSTVVRARLMAASLCIPMLLAGCGNNDGRVPVSGTVLFNGEPLVEGEIVFASPELGSAGVGLIKNGSFTLSQSTNRSGVLPGEYTVGIQSWIVRPGTVDDEGNILPGSKSRIPTDYQNAEISGLTASVQARGKNHFTFELTADGPAGKSGAAGAAK